MCRVSGAGGWRCGPEAGPRTAMVETTIHPQASSRPKEIFTMLRKSPKFVALSLALALVAGLGLVNVAAAGNYGNRPTAASPTLVDKAIEVNTSGMYAGSFDVLLCLVTKYPDIVATLSQKGQYAVFAPTDNAFAAIGITEANCESYQMANADAVKNILLYHVTKGRKDAAAVTTSSYLKMLNGDTAEITSMGGKYYIDGAEIIVTDVPASNGLIHAVGGVLLP
jgi:uncharacterized surface protein with fasciclin (FAS1) repeats